MQRGEEGKALRVVPVQVAEQAGAPKGAVLGLADAEIARTGADVEEQGVVAGDGDQHTGRVAAVTGHGIAVARRRAAHAEERHLHRQTQPPPWVIYVRSPSRHR